VESAREFAALGELPDFASHRSSLQSLETQARQAANGLAAALREADLAGLHIYKPLQWFFHRRVGRPPADAIERLALARVMQWRLLRRLGDALEGQNDLPASLRNAGRQVVGDCAAIVEALSDWLERLVAESQEAEQEARNSLSQYREIDRQVSDDLRPFENALWRVPGLGCDPFQPAAG
jgi:hypothetical protein